MLKVGIIDDEKSARDAIKAILQNDLPEVDLVGEAFDISSGINLINQHKPDVLLLDIRLGTESAFTLLTSLEEFHPALIFITAHSKYAIKAIKCSALDYLLKPIDPIELKQALHKVRHQADSRVLDRLKVLEEHMQTSQRESQRIALSDLEGFHLVKINEIVQCIGEKNYTTFHFTNGRRITTSKSLIEYERLLPINTFLRVYKSHLINLRHVTQVSRGRKSRAIMINGDSVNVSRDKKAELIERLQTLSRT